MAVTENPILAVSKWGFVFQRFTHVNAEVLIIIPNVEAESHPGVHFDESAFAENGFKRFMKGYVHGRSEAYAGNQKNALGYLAYVP